MSIGEKLTEIAENLHGVYGKGYQRGYAEGYNGGYEEGIYNGGIAGKESCLLNHFTTSFFGDDTSELSIQIPFQPDIVTVYTTHSYSSHIPNCYRGFTADLRACGRHMCNVFYTATEGLYKSAWMPSKIPSNNIFYQDGVFRYALSAEAIKDTIWMSNVRYHLVAVRFPEESGKSLLEEQIMMLPDEVPTGCSGVLPYNESVVNYYFAPAEWEWLTAQKPNWTFELR